LNHLEPVMDVRRLKRLTLELASIAVLLSYIQYFCLPTI